MLTMKDIKKYPNIKKNDKKYKNIYLSFGAIEGSVSSYNQKMLDAERAIYDIEEIIKSFNFHNKETK